MPRRPVFAADTPAADLLAWIAAAVAEGFTMPRVLPTLRRAPAEPEPPLPLLFEGLPLQRRGEPAAPPPPPPGMPLSEVMRRHFAGVIAGPSELALKRRKLKAERAEAAAAAAREVEVAVPVPEPEAALTEDEVREIEACLPHVYTYGPAGDAAKARWQAWFWQDVDREQFSVPLKGNRNRASIEVTQTRLGWMVGYDYQYPDAGGRGGGGFSPHMDTRGSYLWADREAAIRYGAQCLLSGAVHPTPGQTIEARARIGRGVKAFFEELGIDPTSEPPADRRRRLISKERIAELQAAGPPQI